jgi:hypothetical protein
MCEEEKLPFNKNTNPTIAKAPIMPTINHFHHANKLPFFLNLSLFVYIGI